MRRVLVILLLVSTTAIAQKGSRIPWITISQIVTCPNDTFRIKAKVIDTYNCPPCPPGAMCKPCDGDYVLVEDTDAKEPLSTNFFVTSTADFAKEAVYIFVLVLRNKKIPEHGSQVVRYETLKK
jgi:hypothetical protein